MPRKPFQTEPEGYHRGVMSDLQGRWGNLREEVAKAHPFPGSQKLLFHIDEAMCWDSVRDLDRIRTAFLLVRNLVAQNEVPEEVQEWTEILISGFGDLDEAISEGEKV